MCDCPMMEKLARIARERDELKAQNRRLIEQKQELINRLMNLKLRDKPSVRVKKADETLIACAWIKEN